MSLFTYIYLIFSFMTKADLVRSYFYIVQCSREASQSKTFFLNFLLLSFYFKLKINGINQTITDTLLLLMCLLNIYFKYLLNQSSK